jgi:hypothetical protein
MVTSASSTREVGQMDSDEDPWQQVYNLIVEGHSRLGVGIKRLDRRLDGMDTRLDGVDTRLDGIDMRLHGIDTRLHGIDTRLNGMESVAEERDGRYMAKFEDLRRLVAKRVLSKEASTTPPPIPPTPPAPRRKRAS